MTKPQPIVRLMDERMFDEVVTNEHRLAEYARKRQVLAEQPTSVFPLVVFDFATAAQDSSTHGQPSA